MKIKCKCGDFIIDSTDGLPSKARIIVDQDWEEVLHVIETAIEESGTSPREKVEACWRVRKNLSEKTRLAWQCRSCGRLHVDDEKGELHLFLPESDRVNLELFRSHPS